MRTSLDEDERGSVGVERVVAWIIVVLAVGFTVAVVAGPGESVATNAPDASFEGSFDDETNTLRLEHAGGNPIRAGPTSSLVVVLSDADGDSDQNVTWVGDDEGVAAYPVDSGDTIAIDDASVDSDGDGNAFDANATVGFELDEGDTARVVWRGRPLGAPGEIAVTIDRITVPASE